MPPRNLLSLASLATGALGQAPPAPADLQELECKVHLYALEFGLERLPSAEFSQELHDALNLDDICTATERRAAKELMTSREMAVASAAVRPAADIQFYVSPNGDDSATGAVDAPFATLERARDAARSASASSAVVWVRGGKYYLERTLELTEEDSHLRIEAYQGEKVILSGSRSLKGQDWSCADDSCKVLQTKISLPTPPATVRSTASDHNFGPAPEIANQLFVDGVRQVRARYPNANPQNQDGKCFSASQRSGESCDGWLDPPNVTDFLPDASVVLSYTTGPNRGDSPAKGCKECADLFGNFQFTIYDPPEGHPVYNKPLPGQDWQNNSVFSYWGSPFWRPAELQASLPNTWARPETGVLHMFHGKLWGSWMFRIAGRDADQLHLGYGGYQEARGCGDGGHFYVENIREELDAPQEWFYDDKEGVLLLYPNGTASTAEELKAADVAVPLLDSLVVVRGNASVAQNISLYGIQFTETRATFLEMYEMPSGGDWAIHRNGAVLVENAEGVSISNCSFNQTGGNALMFSKHVTDSNIEGNEFWQTGESAVAFLGVTVGIDARAATYPNRNRVVNNHMREYGVYGKQSSCFFQSLAANTTFEDNVCYNGPRAGINFNDGFGGGSIVRGNLAFNHVRETGDHGPFNSWDRQPYLTRNGVVDGFSDDEKLGYKGVSIVKAQCYIEQNFFINGYNGVWTIDHDDGSQYYNDSSNAMFWGGCKNYEGHSKSCDHNLIVYPGINERAAAGENRRCQTNDNGVFANQYYHSNNCLTMDGVAYSFNQCRRNGLDVDDGSVFQTANNTFSSTSDFVEDCEGQMSLEDWQALGQDLGSSAVAQPSSDDIVAMARDKLAPASVSEPFAVLI